MSGYPGLAAVKDPAVYAAFKYVWDQILASKSALATLQGQAVIVKDGTPIDAEGERLTDLGDPEVAQDAVTLNYLSILIGNLQHNQLRALQGGSPTPPPGQYYHLTAAQYTALAAIAEPAGGNINQSTNKSTGVTLDSVSGTITMDGAALNADTTVSFTLTNSAIASGSFVLVQHDSVGSVGSYLCTATPGSGSATIYVRNVTPGNLSEAIVLRFFVLP